MKKVLFIIFSLAVLVSCQQQIDNTVTISGNIPGLEGENIFLMQREGRDFLILDTVKVENGSFTINTVAKEIKIHYLGTIPGRPFTDLFVEKGNITVAGTAEDLAGVKVAGTANNELYSAYKVKENELNTALYATYDEYKTAEKDGNKELASELEAKMDAIEEEQTAHTKAFIKENNSSIVSPFLMWRMSYMFELEDLIPVYKSYPEEVKASEYAVFVKERIDLLSKVAVGQKFTDFSMEDTQGNMVALSDLAGEKVTLVDFWASWCSPCRAENPNVVKAWQKYHDKGFQVVGVSFDKDHDAWLQAIADDNLTWPHVSDLSYWDNAAGKIYGIRSIPSNFLMDENGVILAWNLREEALQEKLAELFAE